MQSDLHLQILKQSAHSCMQSDSSFQLSLTICSHLYPIRFVVSNQPCSAHICIQSDQLQTYHQSNVTHIYITRCTTSTHCHNYRVSPEWGQCNMATIPVLQDPHSMYIDTYRIYCHYLDYRSLLIDR